MLFHIWPLMLVVTLAKLVILTCAAGLLGPLIFLALALLFLINYASLYTFCKKTMEEDSPAYKSSEDPETLPLHQNNDGAKSQRRQRGGLYSHCCPMFHLAAKCCGRPNSKNLPGQRDDKPGQQGASPSHRCRSCNIRTSTPLVPETLPSLLL